MMKYLHFILSILTVCLFTSCNEVKSKPYEAQNSRVVFHVDIGKESSSEVFNSLIDICKEYGTVNIVDAQSITKKDMGLLLFLSKSQLSESYLPEEALPEFGKLLPVYKVEISTPQFCNTPENLIFDKQQYLSISDNAQENDEKLLKAFKDMLSDFNFFYKKHKISDSNPDFLIIKD